MSSFEVQSVLSQIRSLRSQSPALADRAATNQPLSTVGPAPETSFTDAAKAMAKRLIKERNSDNERIAMGFQLCTARKPSTKEVAAFLALLKKAKLYYGENETEAKAFNGDAEASSWATLPRIFLNLDEFIPRE